MHNKLTEELAVCGLNAVLALAEYHPDTINRLFLREERLKAFTGLCKRLAERKRPYKLCEDEELERICKSVHHQGVAAMIKEPLVAPLSLEDLDFWAAGGKTGLVLHSVGNDHNLGAIARAAAFFDVHFVILNENDSEARLTTGAYRVAEGGMEHLTVRKVGNTAAFLKDASKRLLVLGTDTRARQRVGDLSGIVKARRGSRPGIALVLGNEETGLPQAVKDCCSCLLRIPGTGSIENLNISQSATLFLYHLFEL